MPPSRLQGIWRTDVRWNEKLGKCRASFVLRVDASDRGRDEQCLA
jgi:hypothetical protein